jgi:hypothetical protein
VTRGSENVDPLEAAAFARLLVGVRSDTPPDEAFRRIAFVILARTRHLSQTESVNYARRLASIAVYGAATAYWTPGGNGDLCLRDEADRQRRLRIMRAARKARAIDSYDGGLRARWQLMPRHCEPCRRVRHP